MSLTPYEYCLSFFRKWIIDYHITPAEIDETDLEMLLDMEILHAKINVAMEQRGKTQAYIEDIL